MCMCVCVRECVTFANDVIFTTTTKYVTTCCLVVNNLPWSNFMRVRGFFDFR